MSVLRSTLTFCADSMLARSFDDIWASGGEADDGFRDSDDEEGTRFYDRDSAYCFEKMVDKLRLLAMTPQGLGPPPDVSIDAHQKEEFKTMVEYYFPGVEAVICDFDSFGSAIC